jgi:hypothetical protein
LLLLVLLVCSSSLGCFGDSPEAPTPKPTRAVVDADDDDDLSSEPSVQHTSRAADVFSMRSKIDEVRYLYEQGRESYAASQAEGLIPLLEPDSRERLELHFLAARCYEKMGEARDRARHDEAFRRLLETLGRSKQHESRINEGRAVRELIDRSIEMARERAPDGPRTRDAQGEEMFNVRCFRRLERVSAEEVLHESFEEGGEIFYGRNGAKVRDHVAEAKGLDQLDVVVQREQRFNFYYCIIEPER